MPPSRHVQQLVNKYWNKDIPPYQKNHLNKMVQPASLEIKHNISEAQYIYEQIASPSHPPPCNPLRGKATGGKYNQQRVASVKGEDTFS